MATRKAGKYNICENKIKMGPMDTMWGEEWLELVQEYILLLDAQTEAAPLQHMFYLYETFPIQ